MNEGEYLGVTGPGVVYVRDIKKFLQQPNAQRQLEALNRISKRIRDEKDI